MKVLGIVAEYNPFHNGHFYHLHESLRQTGADYTICVMSGHFLQRGEPALVDKWVRAQMALQEGVDLVIELPFAYAVRSAQDFAYGALRLLEATGVVDYLSFGSEIGQIDQLRKLAEISLEEPKELKELIKQELSSGRPYPQAQAKALQIFFPDFPTEIWQPNNILAIEYLKALIGIRSPIQPLTIKRKNVNYHDLEVNENFASATGIRELIRKGMASKLAFPEILNPIGPLVPNSTLDLLTNEFTMGKGPIFMEDFGQIILSSLRKSSPKEIAKHLDVIEGLEQRIKKKAHQSVDLENLIEGIKTKRYTRTRIQRIIIHHLLNFSQETALLFRAEGGPQYLRILGISSKGTNLLRKIKQKATLPLIQKVTNYKKEKSTYSPAFEKMLKLDFLASDLYCLAYPNLQYRKGGRDFYCSTSVYQR